MVKELISWVKAIVIALIIVIVVREYILTPSIVRGSSMEPTLWDGDRIIISKLTTIDRFDQIAFVAPDTEVEENYVKRVIGLPGDEVEFVDSILYIDGIAYEEPYLQDEWSAVFSYTNDFSLDLLSLEEVPDGMYFVMGDNRRQSRDSREFGVIDEASIIGEIIFRIWPPENIGLIE